MVVLEKITAPASRNRAAGGASLSAGTSLVVAAPSGTGTPLVAILSLIVVGTPSSGPLGSPFCRRSVDAFATARAPSGSKAYSALICGSHAAICVSTSSSTSDGENCLARKPAIRSTALRSCSEVTASFDAVSSNVYLCTGSHRQSGFDDAREHAGAYRQDFVVEYVAGVVYRHRAVVTNPEIGAGHRMQHVGEILAAHLRLRPGDDLGGIDPRPRHHGDHFGLFLLDHQHAEDVADVDIDLDLERAGNAGADRAHPRPNHGAHFIGEGPD